VKPSRRVLFIVYSAIRFYVYMDIHFVRLVDGGLQQTEARFYTPTHILTHSDFLRIEELAATINASIEHFNRHGSGWKVNRIISATVATCQYRPTQGSSYVETPKYLINKKGVINVYNPNDDLCFAWAVLSALHPSSHNPDRLTHYQPYLNELNLKGLKFPLKIADIHKFEKLNPNISVNVNAFESEPVPELTPLYISSDRHRQHHINLLLLTDDKTGRQHYVWIKSLSRLVHGRTAHTGNMTHVCPFCLHCFHESHTLDNHIPDCKQHSPQRISYPPPGEKLSFNHTIRSYQVPFVLYCDFESYLQPVIDDGNLVNKHVPSGFCCLRVSQYPEHETPPVTYSGLDVMERFFQHLQSEKSEICKILGLQAPMARLTTAQQCAYDSSSTCPQCKVTFTKKNWKVRHHSHVTGQYISPLCNNCNLQMKPRKTPTSNNHFAKVATLEDGMKTRDDDKEEENYFIPVIFHNLRGYDAHHIIKHLKNDSFYETDIKVIPNNTERYVSFEINKMRFLDSFQFLSSSLDTLVKNLPRDHFQYTKRYMPDNDLIFQKGIFPYSHMTGPDVMEETCLPPKEAFYNKLNESHIDDESYAHAQRIWNDFNCKTMRHFHDWYLKLDVLLLADVFENFRRAARLSYNLDPLHYLTLPSFSWDACLKMTGVELDLIDDPEKFLMIENNIRGGISVVSHRYAKANNPYTEDEYDETQPTSYITYVDSNNLYGCAMREPLPTGNFNFLQSDEIASLDIMSIASDSTIGYILDVDLDYPDHLHDSHNDYPLAPERLTVTRDMLSDYSRELSEGHPPVSEKLTPNLRNKRNYVLHYRNLQLYMRLGLKLVHIHRVLAFEQRPWMRDYIDFNTKKRQAACNEFEKDFFKLMNNAVFGKTMECLRNRVNVHLVLDPVRCKKLAARPTCQRFEIINPDLVMMKLSRAHITQNKPIYIGFTVLELSKITMYEFHYDRIVSKYGPRVRLLYTDTDSFMYHIQTDDLYRDMTEDSDIYDTSNFDEQHPLYSVVNKKVVGKFKVETGCTAPSEFVGLRSKLYSLSINSNTSNLTTAEINRDFKSNFDTVKPKMTAKGIKRSYVHNHLNHQNFLNTLNTKKSTQAEFLCFRSHNHVLNTVKINKTCLSSYDDKRYILSDGIATLAYGHYSIQHCNN